MLAGAKGRGVRVQVVSGSRGERGLGVLCQVSLCSRLVGTLVSSAQRDAEYTSADPVWRVDR